MEEVVRPEASQLFTTPCEISFCSLVLSFHYQMTATKWRDLSSFCYDGDLPGWMVQILVEACRLAPRDLGVELHPWSC